MKRHPSSFDLRLFAAGNLPTGRGRQVVTHMMRGCAACSRQLAPIIESSEEGTLQDDSAMAKYDAPIDRAFRTALEQTSELPRRRRAAVRILALLSVHARRWSELTEAQRRRLKGLSRVEALFEEARSLRHSDPAQMLHFAELVRQAAEELSPRRYGRLAVADLKALTWAELGNSYRISAQFDRSHHALGQAALWCGRGSKDPLIQAAIGTLVASFLDDQRRFSDAFDLLDQVVRVYLDHDDHHNAGRALIQKGTYAGFNNQPRLAMALICRGLGLLDRQRDPGLYLSALHNVLSFMVDDGAYRSARIHLWRLRPELLASGGQSNLLRLRWLEGRISAGLGDLDRAETAFRETKEGFREIGEIYSTALAGLDLAAVWLRQGRMDEVRDLAAELITTFRALRIAREAVAVLLFLCQACERRTASVGLIEAAVMMLKELERQPARPHRPEGSET